jgi:aspartyl-tRNA(Asn)/glutamyl-tRNA(Gln) amidotransferase subunit C
MIDLKEVEHIAKLSRLNLTEQEKEKFQKELSLILDYIEKLKEANVKDVKPTSHPFDIENVMRRDLPIELDEKTVKKLLELSPFLKGAYVKVKQILKNSNK